MLALRGAKMHQSRLCTQMSLRNIQKIAAYSKYSGQGVVGDFETSSIKLLSSHLFTGFL